MQKWDMLSLYKDGRGSYVRNIRNLLKYFLTLCPPWLFSLTQQLQDIPIHSPILVSFFKQDCIQPTVLNLLLDCFILQMWDFCLCKIPLYREGALFLCCLPCPGLNGSRHLHAMALQVQRQLICQHCIGKLFYNLALMWQQSFVVNFLYNFKVPSVIFARPCKVTVSIRISDPFPHPMITLQCIFPLTYSCTIPEGAMNASA